MGRRTAERTAFLSDVLETALYHSGYGWFRVVEYDADKGVAVIEEYESCGACKEHERHTVDLDTIAKGLGVLRRTEPAGFAGEALTMLRLADRTNGDDGDYDVIGGLAVIECALFGKVVYA